MGLQTTLTFTCDLPACTGNKGAPAVVSWVKEHAERDDAAMPELAKYLVMFSHNGVLKTFCCQLHAAESFLPPGYEAKQKQVIEMPKKPVEESGPIYWHTHKDDEPTVLRSENEALPQPDGYSSPDNGPEAE